MNKINPLVTVVVVAYNHQKYIQEAMDSFLAQKTNFGVEILVHDDASTDNTQSILQTYADRFPERVHLILEKENQFSKTGAKFLEAMYSRATGKYIAVCEGDDYWIDPLKLQQQVDYLESHPKHTICFHPVLIQREDTSDQIAFPAPEKGHIFGLEELLQHNYIQTNSVMYRNLHDYAGVCPDGILPQDWFTHIFHAKQGKIGYIDKPMGIYRRHREGMWWQDSNENVKFWERNAIRHVLLFENIEKLFSDNNEYLKIIYQSVTELIGRICNEVGEEDGYGIATNIATRFPRYMAIAVTQGVSEGPQPHLELKRLKNKIVQLERESQTQTEALQLLKKEMADLLNSKSWKLTKPLRAMHTRLKHQ